MVPLTKLLHGNGSRAERESAWDAASAPTPPLECALPASGPVAPTTMSHEAVPPAGARPTRQARSRRSRLLVFLSLLGPGIVATSAGNDAGGILTYIQAGAAFGYAFIWAIVLVTFSYYVVQEMCARMGAVTGKGLADLIRENYGVKITAFAMTVQLIANLATTVTEFAGVSAACHVFGMPDLAVRFVAIPITMVLLFFLIAGNSYAKAERVFLVMSALLLAYVIAAIRLHPDWFWVSHETVHPDIIGHVRASGAAYITMLIALIGTTIAPYQQFYLQSAIRDKGITMRQYATTRFDVLFGCVSSNIVSIFIVVACAVTLFVAGRHGITDVEQASRVLSPLAGPIVAKYLFGTGLLGASILAAVIVPLTTAYAVTESLGWETGVGRKVRESPIFYGTYAAMLLFGGVLLMFPQKSLVSLIINAQVVNGLLLPVELVLMILLCSKRWLMGKWRNSTVFNFIAWATIAIVASLAIADVALTVFGGL